MNHVKFLYILKSCRQKEKIFFVYFNDQDHFFILELVESINIIHIHINRESIHIKLIYPDKK